jgi:hypothetical protein
MGCSRHHRDQESRKRSAEYYRTKEGKQKKKDLNDKRSKSGGGETTPVAADPGKREWCLLKYLRFILVRVDRRRASMDEVGRLYKGICKILRQHGLEEWRKLGQSPDG